MKKLNLWQRANQRIASTLIGPVRAYGHNPSDEYCYHYWSKARYAWWSMLIPVAGMVGVFITNDDAHDYAKYKTSESK